MLCVRVCAPGSTTTPRGAAAAKRRSPSACEAQPPVVTQAAQLSRRNGDQRCGYASRACVRGAALRSRRRSSRPSAVMFAASLMVLAQGFSRFLGARPFADMQVCSLMRRALGQGRGVPVAPALRDNCGVSASELNRTMVELHNFVPALILREIRSRARAPVRQIWPMRIYRIKAPRLVSFAPDFACRAGAS